VRDRIVTDDDHLSFKVIIHGEREGRPARALIILSHGHIIGSHYLAYVDPATLPAYPFAARDASSERVAAEIKNARHEVYRCRASEPHEIVYRPFVRVKPRRFGEPYGYDWQGGPITIKASGKIVRADIASRLEYLRGEIRAERISWGEIARAPGLGRAHRTGRRGAARGGRSAGVPGR
jgi:hypothetical protein